jgi:RNA polymerase sigma-70 factor, ECF subfamily
VRTVEAMQPWLAAGRARWPEVELDAQLLADHLARLGIDRAIVHAHAADLYLACGCAAGVPAAVAAFDRELIPIARAAARRIDATPDFVEEIAQLARARLLVAEPASSARIADYTGEGPLRAWVRIAALRLAMNQLRGRRRDVLVDDETFFAIVDAGTDEERRQSRARYSAVCGEALRAAFGELTARERNLLRMHHLHGLTIDELAPTLRVHRATVARWLATARERLLDATRAGLRERLDVGTATVDSILRELAGRIDVSVTRLLAE